MLTRRSSEYASDTGVAAAVRTSFLNSSALYLAAEINPPVSAPTQVLPVVRRSPEHSRQRQQEQHEEQQKQQRKSNRPHISPADSESAPQAPRPLPDGHKIDDYV